MAWGGARATTPPQYSGTEREPFYGVHQAGIATRPQAHATLIGLDLADSVDRVRLAGLLKVWTTDAARLTQGKPTLSSTEPEMTPLPSRLTVTVGFGPGVFTATGLEDRAPSWLRPLPPFAVDRLDAAWAQTDLLLQLCGDDPLSIAHAQRELLKNVRTLVQVQWVQTGFRRARGSEPSNTTMRNLMGQVDGTVNLNPAIDFDTAVWDDGARQPWLAGGTSMVLRRIRMDLDTWDELDRPARELTIGRNLSNGAPLTGTREDDEPDMKATDAFGIPVMPPGSHVARARPAHVGERFFRRAYNYDDPPLPGELSNSGLIFATFQRDVDAQFLPVQQRLAEHDALNQWTTPIGSAVYAIAPGVQEGTYLGSTLLG